MNKSSTEEHIVNNIQQKENYVKIILEKKSNQNKKHFFWAICNS
jgi:hypothetical protein